MNNTAPPIRSYRDLLVWQKAMNLAEAAYRLTQKLPSTELYGLSSQIQRSACSVAANIAEGHGRRHTGDFLRFLAMANGSLMELETHLLLAERLSMIQTQETDEILKLTMEVGKMLAGLIHSLNKKAQPPES
jgi:four helix bundle protein